MSCQHGNSVSHCEICAEIDAAWAAGEASGKRSVEHCQCSACTITHASDCAVHNMPAMPVEPCNCGAFETVAHLLPSGERGVVEGVVPSIERIGWDKECDDVDRIIEKLGMTIEQARTEGGCLHLPRILNHIQETLDALAVADGFGRHMSEKYVTAVHAATHSPAQAAQVDGALYKSACDSSEEWKARALKAEELSDRLMAEINDMTGPTFMGGPVMPKPHLWKKNSALVGEYCDDCGAMKGTRCATSGCAPTAEPVAQGDAVDQDSIALRAASDIALMWGEDRSQFVSKTQVRVLEAIAAVKAQPRAVPDEWMLTIDITAIREVIAEMKGEPLGVGLKHQRDWADKLESAIK